jgi:transcriptional regulator with XRE-family HTH domain
MDSQALGQMLRQTREAKELTLEDAEAALKIRRRLLEGFELGEFRLSEFSPVQTRGFIRNYATYLSLDADRILQMLDDALAEEDKRARGRRAKPTPARESPREGSAPIPPTLPQTNGGRIMVEPKRASGEWQSSQPPPPRRRVGIGAVLLRLALGAASIAVIVFVVVELVQPTLSGESAPAENGVPTGEGILGSLPPTATFTPPPTQIALFAPSPTANLQPGFTGQGVFLTVNATQRTWMRLTVDGAELFTGTLRPGTVLEYSGNQTISLTASNAAALDLVFNGQAQGVLGRRGQHVDAEFTASGARISSAPSFDPTPIASPTPMPTPTDSAGALVAPLTLTPSEPTPLPLPGIESAPTETSEVRFDANALLNLTLPAEGASPAAAATVPGVPTMLPLPGAATSTSTPTDMPATDIPPTETPPPTSTPTDVTPTETPPPTNTPTDIPPTETPLPTNTPAPSATPQPTNTPAPTATPTFTPSPTLTFTPTPTNTSSAILPPRYTPTNPTPTKALPS